MDLTRDGLDQAEDPIKIQHPEEEEHHENGGSKMFRKVKETAKKFKNKYIKHGQGNEHEHHVGEEDDESGEEEPEKHDASVYESSAVRDGVTGQPESLAHGPETTVPAPEEITPPRTKVFPVVSSDYTRPVETEPLQDTSYGQEAPPHPIREAPSPPLRVSDLSEREVSREAHHEPLTTPVSLLSTTEDDVTRTLAPGEDEYLEGQRKGNIETPERLEEVPAAQGGGLAYLSHVSNYESKVPDPTKEGDGEAEVAEIDESLGKMKVTDESRDQKLGDLSTKSQEFERESESGIGKDSPATLGGESGAELGKDFPTRSFEFDQKTESGNDKDSSTGFGEKPGTGLSEDFPTKGHEFDQKIESGIGNDTGFGEKPGTEMTETEMREAFLAASSEFDQDTESGIGNDTGFGEKPGTEMTGTEMREAFLAASSEFDQDIKSVIGNDSPTEFDGESGTGQREDFPAKSLEFDQKILSGIENDKPGTEMREDFLGKSYEFDQEIQYGIGKDSPTRSDGKLETRLGEEFPARSDDVKVDDQFSPELSRPKERDDFDTQVEETRDEAQEPKPSTYTEQIGSATSLITDKAIAGKSAVVSRLGYSGETTESPVEVQTPGTVSEKLIPDDEKDKETGSTVTTKLPLSDGGSGAEETKQGVTAKDYLAKKLTHGEEDKALAEVIAEKRNLGGDKKTTKEVEVPVEKIPSDKISEETEHGEAVAEEGKGGGGGMVGKIKGAYNYWLGGATEEVKPTSPVSVEESSQSLGSTVGTKGFPSSGESELGETGGGGGAVPVQRGL